MRVSIPFSLQCFVSVNSYLKLLEHFIIFKTCSEPLTTLLGYMYMSSNITFSQSQSHVTVPLNQQKRLVHNLIHLLIKIKRFQLSSLGEFITYLKSLTTICFQSI
jgi:hypothetical protein